MRTVRTIEQEAERRAKLAGVPTEAVLGYVAKELKDRPFQITYETLPHYDIAEVLEIGDEAIKVIFNVRHEWVLRVMLGKQTSVQDRSGMEVMLVTLLGARLGLSDEGRTNYQLLIRDLSDRLQTATQMLFAVGKDGLDMFGDDPNADDEEEEEDATIDET